VCGARRCDSLLVMMSCMCLAWINLVAFVDSKDALSVGLVNPSCMLINTPWQSGR
jgi:hypothetical protein